MLIKDVDQQIDCLHCSFERETMHNLNVATKFAVRAHFLTMLADNSNGLEGSADGERAVGVCNMANRGA